MVSVEDLTVAPEDAAITDESSIETGSVEIVKLAVVAPSATVTVLGMDTLFPLQAKETTKPVAGAGPAIVTVPVLVVPPRTEAGFIASPMTAFGKTVSSFENCFPALEAVKFAVLLACTGLVATVNVADENPAGTATVFGTDAIVGLLFVIVTV